MKSDAARFFGHGLPYKKIGELKGSLIVIEGTDGVGRSTQTELLKPWLELEGYGVTSTGLTRSLLLAETIDEAKRGHELNVLTFSLLYAADFADRLENEIIPALQAGFVVIADRYMYTAFARNDVMGADPGWSRTLFGFGLVPDLVLYLKIDVQSLIPRVLGGKGMDYWESGMHLALGSDIFESFRNYQTRLIREYNALAREFCFVTIDARQPVEVIQAVIRQRVGRLLQARKRRGRTDGVEGPAERDAAAEPR
ncbi:MAG: dTMP kinase [Candidatus Binatota bacterium]|nr:dTMP kinase [Candidatus Binatota bacterium]